MSSRPKLHLDWCSHAAAEYAVRHWHYSRRMPKSKLAKIGVWEDGVFVGVIVFGVGAGNSTNGKRFGLRARFEMAELLRVALREHNTPVSRMIAVAVRMVRRAFPGLRLLTSFADGGQGHIGAIYQAAGWVYIGGKQFHAYRVHGIVTHPRTLYDRYGLGGQSIPWLRAHVDPMASRERTPVKYQYVYPLDAEIRLRLLPFAQPYPKRVGSIDGDAPAIHAGEGGSSPTPTLQLETAR